LLPWTLTIKLALSGARTEQCRFYWPAHTFGNPNIQLASWLAIPSRLAILSYGRLVPWMLYDHTMVLPGIGECRFDWPAGYVRKSEHAWASRLAMPNKSYCCCSLFVAYQCLPTTRSQWHGSCVSTGWGSAIKCPSHEGCTGERSLAVCT
jgi:hypothetical protein